MIPRSALVFLFMCLWWTAHGQERNRHWVYNSNIRLNMGSIDPEIDTGPFFWPQGVGHASISDTNGNLVLYTSADSVHGWGGSGIPGDEPLSIFSEMYNALALPIHEGDQHYLLFLGGSTSSGPSGGRLAYVVIDPYTNGGNGQVLSDELIILDDSMSCVIAATPHANGVDYWVLGHGLGNDAFHCYKTNGALPPYSALVTHTGPAIAAQSWTYMDARFSYNGDLLAVAYGMGGELLLYRFDDATGQLDPLFSDSSAFSSVEFSLSGRFLYAIDRTTETQHIYQYDLSSSEPTAILASKTPVFDLPYVIFEDDLFTLLRAGPDGRIYFNELYNSPAPSMLSWIEHPDDAGSGCDVQFEAIDVSPGYFFNGSAVNQCRRYHDSGSTVGMPALLRYPRFLTRPNPVSSVMLVDIPVELRSPRVRMEDNVGRSVLEVSGQVALGGTIDVSGLAPGLYAVRLLDGSVLVGQARVIVQ